MKLYSENENYKLYQGNMLDMLEVIEKESIDSIVTDPPYELNFMSKGWDNAGVSFQPDTWRKCYEVLKPGGYLLAFGGSRTFHRIACAIEDAGFEIRDTIMWLYGSGFPKSMSLSKGLEAREKLGNAGTRNKRKIEQDCDTEEYTLKQTNNGAMGEMIETTRKEYIPNTDLAKQWQGWGTCLKPSFEPIIVARKPFKGSLVDNVIEYGVGGINIDECRVGNEELHNSYMGKRSDVFSQGRTDTEAGMFTGDKKGETIVNGRFPANTILTYDETDYDEVCGGFPNTKSQVRVSEDKDIKQNTWSLGRTGITPRGHNDSGSASRYFMNCKYTGKDEEFRRYIYTPKASKKDRDEGLDEFEEVDTTELLNRKANTAGILWEQGGTNAFSGAGGIKKNTHPTVKPTDLMQYLVRLVSPNGATILDPFNGSGSTGKAVMYENKERNKNYKYIGIELTEEYLPIAKARIEYVCNLKEDKLKDMQMSIFDYLESKGE